MEAIRNYVESMFASLPQTEDVLQVKSDMLSNLEEKYQVLLAEGVSENEAIGRILSSIGSVEDLYRELNLSKEDPAATSHANPEQNHANAMLTPEIQEEYRQYSAKKNKMIAVAVGLFILSPCMYLLFNGILAIDFLSSIAFLGMIAAGVGICILSGKDDEYYRDIYGLTDEGHRGKKRGKNSLAGLFAAIAFPIATVIYLCLGFVSHLWHPGWLIFVACGIFTGILGAVEDYRNGTL